MSLRGGLWRFGFGLLLVLACVSGVAGRALAETAETAYVVNADSGTVTPIDVATNEAGKPITVGTEPEAVAITPNGNTAYVTSYDTESVTPIEVATNTAGKAITKVGSAPYAIAITPNGKTAYVTDDGNGMVTPIELATNTVGKPIKVGGNPRAIAITPNGETAYVANASYDSVTPIELATNTAGKEIAVGGEPRGIAIAPDGKTAYVVNVKGTVPIDVATNKAGKEITVGKEPVAIAITPDGKTAYVANYNSESVTPIDLETSEAGTKITVEKEPYGVAITPDGRTAYVANADSASVTPIEVATNTAGTKITVGKGPVAIAITPAPPTVVTDAATALTETQATLNGTVNPEGVEVTGCEFEYGTTTAYGSSVPCNSLPGSGESPVAVSAVLTGLTANTEYHFRISATNANRTNVGEDVTFKTSIGAFVIGNEYTRAGETVTFWNWLWDIWNPLSEGAWPLDFSGFATSIANNPPQCGESWTSGLPGLFSNAPASLPEMMYVVVSSSITSNGNWTSPSMYHGNAVEVLLVKTNPGYGPDWSHTGTGTIVSQVCSDPVGNPSTSASRTAKQRLGSGER